MRRPRAAPPPPASPRGPRPEPESEPSVAILTWEQFDDGAATSSPPSAGLIIADEENDDADAGVVLSDSLASLLARPDRAPPPARRRRRWRRLLARQDLVDKGLAVRSPAPDRPSVEQSPRSSFDFEEPKSQNSWCDEPPSPTLRSWRSISSRTFVPRQEEPPRPLAQIGRQACMNDISDIVDAANSPCISYDRQLFDPVSKLWRYVEADGEPISSQWELGPNSLGSPVTTTSANTVGGAASSSARASLPNLPVGRQRISRSDAPFRERTMMRERRKVPRGIRAWSPPLIGRQPPSPIPRSMTPSRSDDGGDSAGVTPQQSDWTSPQMKCRASWDAPVAERGR